MRKAKCVDSDVKGSAGWYKTGQVYDYRRHKDLRGVVVVKVPTFDHTVEMELNEATFHACFKKV